MAPRRTDPCYWWRIAAAYPKLVFAANERFPDLELDTALNNYVWKHKIKNIFFYSNVNRGHCIWRSEPPHTSEVGWNLPLEDKRHFFNLPQEIQDMILGYVLKVPCNQHILIDGFFERSNRRDERFVFKWNTRMGSNTLISHSLNDVVELRQTSREDLDGLYVELREGYRTFDPACLRTCRQLHHNGISVLYGNNTFFFRLPWADGGPRHEGSHIPIDMRALEFQVLKASHLLDNDMLKEIILHVKYYITGEVNPIYDAHHIFLHFLETIGLKNAAKLKALGFDSGRDSHISDDFRYYLPVMRMLCMKLERLIIWDNLDPTMFRNSPLIVSTQHEVLKSLLKNEILEHRNLIELEVSQQQRVTWWDRYDSKMRSVVAEYAKPAIDKVGKRTLKRARREYASDI